MSPACQTRAFNSIRVCLHNYHHSFFPKLEMRSSRVKIKSQCVFCNRNNRNNADAFDKFHSHIPYCHIGPMTASSLPFSLSLHCHKHYGFQKCFLDGCFELLLAHTCWGICVNLPQEQFDSSACACLKAWHGFAPSLLLRLVETNGQTNEPPAGTTDMPHGLVRKPRWRGWKRDGKAKV